MILPELPQLPEGITIESPHSPAPPPPIRKDSIRSRSPSTVRRRPPPPPKDRGRSRGSTLQLVSTNPDLLAPPNGTSKRRPPRKRQNHFLSQLASLKQWFKESARRGKSPSANKSETSTLRNSPQEKKTPTESRRSPKFATPVYQTGVVVTPTRQLSGASSLTRPQMPTPRKRASLSPAPATPRSYHRHSSGASGLRGRKSTSSSVSSIRSVHYLPSHSKASSTSSTSNSVHSSAPYAKTSRSPHPSVKVLVSTPTANSFPSNVRLVRGPPSHHNNYNESASFGSPTGLMFAKRKKTPFRGPILSIGTGGGGVGSPAARTRESSAGPGNSRSASVAGRASGEIIQEEDEEEIEEVDNFSPVGPEADESVWEGPTATVNTNPTAATTTTARDADPDGRGRR